MYLILSHNLVIGFSNKGLNPYSNGTMYLIAKIAIDYILRY